MSGLLSLGGLWEHWEGHRRLTLRTVEAYPEASFSELRVGGMRPFSELMAEIVNVEDSVMRGLAAGVWAWEPRYAAASKAELLDAFEAVRAETRRIFPGLSEEKLRAVETDAWGVTQPNLGRVLYLIDNEIHHRAQGYVYLRQLGVEPPPFYAR